MRDEREMFPESTAVSRPPDLAYDLDALQRREALNAKKTSVSVCNRDLLEFHSHLAIPAVSRPHTRRDTSL